MLHDFIVLLSETVGQRLHRLRRQTPTVRNGLLRLRADIEHRLPQGRHDAPLEPDVDLAVVPQDRDDGRDDVLLPLSD